MRRKIIHWVRSSGGFFCQNGKYYGFEATSLMKRGYHLREIDGLDLTQVKKLAGRKLKFELKARRVHKKNLPQREGL